MLSEQQLSVTFCLNSKYCEEFSKLTVMNYEIFSAKILLKNEILALRTYVCLYIKQLWKTVIITSVP
jgi:hypothetical protein